MAYETFYQQGSLVSMEIVNKTSLRYTVHLPKNQYLGLGFGTSMTNTDMVIFRSGSTPEVIDVYSESRTIPSRDSSQDV